MFGTVSAWVRDWGVTAKALVPATLVVCGTTAVIIYCTWRNTREQAIGQSLSNAEQTIQQYKALREYYTTNVVRKVAGRTDLRASHDHKDRADAIPLPATLIHDLGEEAARTRQGAQLRLYSSHPFPHRRDRRPDDFAQEAMAHFQKNPDAPTFTRIDRLNGEETVRVAIADRMVNQACVNCHNKHPDSPKKDWQVGDLRGVLEVDTSIERPLEEAASRLRFVAGVALAGGVTVLGVIAFSLRRVRRKLDEAVRVFEATGAGDLSQRVAVSGGDELGRMGRSLNVMVETLRSARETERERVERDRQLAAERADQEQQQVERDRQQAERERQQAERDRRQVAERGDQERQQAERDRQQAAERENLAAALRAKVDAMLVVVDAAAAGDLTRTVTVAGADPVGRMGEGLGQFLADLRGRIGAIAGTAGALLGSSEELSAVSQRMGASSEATATQAGTVSAAAEQVSQSVQTVAAAVEQMNASVLEISRNAADGARIAASAASAAQNTNATIAKLGTSSAEIGQVVKVITSIAQQTNLLALNATIEAARAGEAGKGFAVVANEVKELAKETARATEEIGEKIAAIQADTGSAVAAIREITEVVSQITDISSAIAAAVEEQTATTAEISRNVSEAARGSSEIAQSVTSVAQSAQDTTAGANSTRDAAAGLRRMAAELQDMVAKFRIGAESRDPTPTNRLHQEQARNSKPAGQSPKRNGRVLNGKRR